MTVSELFFGQDIAGQAPLTEKQWSEFVASTIAGEFPDGFTVMDADGEWDDPATNTVESEHAKFLVVATTGAPKERIER